MTCLPRAHRPIALAVLAVVLATGCGTPTDPSPPPGSPTASVPTASPGLTPVPGGTTAASPTILEAGQADSDWGRIWDALPPSFPRYPGATPTETGAGPASAELVLPADVPTATSYMQAALETAGYSTEALSGPFEDGSTVIDSVGATAECRAQTRIAPLGELTVMTVLFGVGCPFR